MGCIEIRQLHNEKTEEEKDPFQRSVSKLSVIKSILGALAITINHVSEWNLPENESFKNIFLKNHSKAGK